MQHLLKKQVIDLEISSSLNAYAVQHSMSQHFWKHILPLLEKIFDELGSENEHIKSDKLEIDLGCITLECLERATWSASFLQEIEQKLRSALQMQFRDKKPVKEPTATAIFRQWLFYMENGHLPWNGINLSKEHNTVLESLATEYSSISALRQLLRKPIAMSRIILQHNEKFLQTLAAVLTTKKQEGLVECINEIMSLPAIAEQHQPGTSYLPVHHARKNIWQQVLSFAAESKEQPGRTEIVLHVLSQYIGNSIIAHQLVTDPLVQKTSLHSIISKIAASLPATITSEISNEKNTEEHFDKTSPALKEAGNNPETQSSRSDKKQITSETEAITEHQTSSSQEIHTNTPISIDTVKQQERSNKTSSLKEHLSPEIKNNQSQPAATSDEFGLAALEPSEETNLEEGLFINFAGLVLVHPFLSTLFKKLHWTENGKFISIDQQQRALYLLQYMATGQSIAEEYELVIAKLLCGYPLQLPVAKGLELDAATLKEADNMLEALIAQWEILKQTSITGLREGFFQRSGKLSSKNERMYLHVESKSIDLLLDQLPWNLSIIKLSWMKDLLNVDWR